MGAIIGGVIGGIVGLLLILLAVGLIIYFIRRNKSNKYLDTNQMKYEQSPPVSTSSLNVAEMENLSYIEAVKKPSSSINKLSRAQRENMSIVTEMKQEPSSGRLPDILGQRNNLINYTVLSPDTLKELS